NVDKIIAYDIIIDSCDLDLYVSFDNVEIGRMMARYALSKKNSGNYVLLWGDSSMKVAHWIREGQMEVLDQSVKSGDVNLVYKSYIIGWSKSEASHIVQKVLNFSQQKVDVFLASSDGISAGVIDALEVTGIENAPVITGQDASSVALEFIRNGKQSMSVFKSFENLAKIAAHETIKLIKNQEIDYDTILFNGRSDVKSVLLETSIVDYGNIEEMEIKDDLITK
ncbi:MAG: substrate-binding domain-containing protein, partial [Prolixibacteraceae bacterium]|nr:substrate-binding domain-containing protein [Prolixibacteraceae bacterium]